MIWKAALQSPAWRRQGGVVGRVTMASFSCIRNFSTDMHRLNEDNMVQYHDTHHTNSTALKQEWDTFKGIPVLKISEEQQRSLEKNQHQQQQQHVYGETPRVSLLMELTDRVGVLHDVLKYFWKYDVNVCRIESRPVQSGRWGGKHQKFDFYVDFDGSLEEKNVAKLLEALGPLTEKLIVLDERDVHWFPVSVSVFVDCSDHERKVES
jgi:hypothetical protein